MSTNGAKTLLAFGLGIVLAAIVAIGLIVAGDDGDGAGESQAAAGSEAEATSPAAPRTAPTSVADIYERVSPGVVFVSARGGRETQSPLPFGPDGPPGGGGVATGSGFLIDREGFIVTNDHVVGGARTINVRFGDGGPIRAELRGRDPSSDIALLQIDPEEIPDEVAPVELGSSENLRPGDAAIAIGSPFGLSGSITTGIISALDRDIPAPNGFIISGALQTDAAMNPGNSGGPLLDAAGRAIGVNSQIATGGNTAQSSGVGFAVPIDTVQEVVPALRRGEVVERAWLGVSTVENPAGEGVVIGGVVPDSPADEAGIQPGDVIVGMGGETVRDPGDVGSAVNARDPGDRVELEIERGGERRTVEVTLAQRPQEPPS